MGRRFRNSPRQNTIPLYRMDGTYLKHVSQDEADNRIYRREAEYRCAKCFRNSARGRCVSGADHKMELHMTVPLRNDGASPCTITASECEANVGIGGETKVASAQRKVGAWLETFDTKAPCIGWLRYPHDDRSVQVARA